MIYTCNADGQLRGHEIESGKLVWEASLPGLAALLEMAPDGRHLFTHNQNGTVYVLRLNAK